MPKDVTSAPLEDVMLAMDVVDTLRHRRGLVERELRANDRRAQLIDQLRDIYHTQGLEVSDEVLEQGVAALEENRFSYDPPTTGLRIALARAYVKRSRWMVGTLTIVFLVVTGVILVNMATTSLSSLF